jgi:hypothetical protein
MNVEVFWFSIRVVIRQRNTTRHEYLECVSFVEWHCAIFVGQTSS